MEDSIMFTEYLQKTELEGKVRNLTDSTIASYICCISHFLTRTNKSPDTLDSEDVRGFILLKKEEGLKPRTLNLYNSSIHFFFRFVLRIFWDDSLIPRMKLDHPLPTILTLEKVEQLLAATEDLKYKAMFSTLYSSGMRISEVRHLHYGDISRSNMQVYIRESKSRSDRYTILSQRNLDILTEYWKGSGHPMGILFPSRNTGSYLSNAAVSMSLRRSLKSAGLAPEITSHDFRHSFATHLLESGVEIRYIQALLGHRDPRSTQIYLHTSNKFLLGISSPFDKKGEPVHG